MYNDVGVGNGCDSVRAVRSGVCILLVSLSVQVKNEKMRFRERIFFTEPSRFLVGCRLEQ